MTSPVSLGPIESNINVLFLWGYVAFCFNCPEVILLGSVRFRNGGALLALNGVGHPPDIGHLILGPLAITSHP